MCILDLPIAREYFDLKPDSDRPDEIKYYTYTWQYRAVSASIQSRAGQRSTRQVCILISCKHGIILILSRTAIVRTRLNITLILGNIEIRVGTVRIQYFPIQPRAGQRST